ncbi:MAG: class II histone deacetylase [Alphaproteobacteria bacterium]|nr:class II histone deacetylase [Alphaproteobacteria bacterium]
MQTGFFWDERCFWHDGHGYALTTPVGGLVQPMTGGGYPDSPETKRRLKNLIDASGLAADLRLRGAEPATEEELLRVHPRTYLDAFRALSDADGGELGLRAPFGRGGYDIAALSAGLARDALFATLTGRLDNAYALSRPPGHHCLPEHPNGFCLLANIAIAIEAAFAEGLAGRIAVVDWDVHHGNGTEAIFYDRNDVLTISLHQDRNYPMDTGDAAETGAGVGAGHNINIPLPPGTGHNGYLAAMDQLVLPALTRYAPDAIIIACGFDAAAVDPLGRMMATAETFRALTRSVMRAADDLCYGRLTLVHEGGYSELYVPFCGHAVLEELSGSRHNAPDPLAETLRLRQPDGAFDAFVQSHLTALADHFDL